MIFWVIGLTIALAAGLLYYLLIVTEGTYLGVGVVIWLYDRVARRYDHIKNLNYVHESRFIGLPLSEALADVDAPKVLDVATGTGRTPLALLREPDFQGTLVGVDRSELMLERARAALPECDGRVTYLRGDAEALGFADSVFDAVVCLEALEFMPHAARAVREMSRVLKPGGQMLLSNRVGADARFYPGRLCKRGRLEQFLREIGLENVVMQRWQVHYDLVWARKPRADAPQAGSAPALRQA